jgi:carboxylesterase
MRPGRHVTPLLDAEPDPARDYAAALARCVDLQGLDGDEVNPVCRSRLLAHGLKTEHALVLVHGVANCPAQFAQLAPLFFEQGYNVLIPRIPWNGLLDRSGAALRHLSARELRAFGDAVVDIACGLGERVTVVGLSGGGVVAAWAAQYRREVERAVVIAPAIGTLPGLPFGNVLINRLAMRLARILPNLMTQRFLPTPPGPPHRYDGFATRGIAAVMQLGFAVLDAARTETPAAGSIQVVINDNDTTVDSAVARDLARRWRATAGDRVAVYTFARDRGLIHDLIDPAQPSQQTDFVYPILVELIAPAGVRPRGETR